MNFGELLGRGTTQTRAIVRKLENLNSKRRMCSPRLAQSLLYIYILIYIHVQKTIEIISPTLESKWQDRCQLGMI